MKQTKPKMACDLIMKGGTTSGTLYPKAIQEIMKKYRLVNIGGTSAGAIAAAAAAAAEKGRAAGFEQKLDKLAEDLPKKLLSFFQPRQESRFLFDIGLAWLDRKNKWDFLRRLTNLWAKQYPIGACTLIPLVACSAGVSGVGVVVALGWALSDWSGLLWAWGSVILILASILCGIAWLVISAFRTYKLAEQQLSSSHGFGICPGAKQDWADTPAFTDWFSDRLNDLSGLAGRDKPLTFGDLAGPNAIEGSPTINLIMMTTSITDGGLVKVPFDARDRYLFREADWTGKIPQSVLYWMIQQSERILLPGTKDDEPYYFLPSQENLPVILAVRMSMSFPLLFTTTTLYRFRGEEQQPLKVVFTDGGVTSNFPIHFFDNIWPSRPTFGITLDRTDSKKATALVPKFGTEVTTNSPRDLRRVGDFVSALLSTMQDWTDDQQSSLLSAQQRIVHIPLLQEEGGLNLTMPEERIKRLIERGQQAGEKFGEFDEDQHRWTRYVSSIISFAEAQAKMQEAWNNGDNNGRLSLHRFVEDYVAHGNAQGQSVEWQEQAREFATHLVSYLNVADQIHPQPGHDVNVRIVSDT